MRLVSHEYSVSEESLQSFLVNLSILPCSFVDALSLISWLGVALVNSNMVRLNVCVRIFRYIGTLVQVPNGISDKQLMGKKFTQVNTFILPANI
jgi:uncharacterized membrane protein